LAGVVIVVPENDACVLVYINTVPVPSIIFVVVLKVGAEKVIGVGGFVT
jgi:hypothetical protein